jgi:hypothetical protein
VNLGDFSLSVRREKSIFLLLEPAVPLLDQIVCMRHNYACCVYTNSQGGVFTHRKRFLINSGSLSAASDKCQRLRANSLKTRNKVATAGMGTNNENGGMHAHSCTYTKLIFLKNSLLGRREVAF